MQRKGANISLSSYDEIFQTEEARHDTGEHVIMVNLEKIHPFKDHPLRVVDDEDMRKTADSIREYGVLVPAIVRPLEDGEYEMISGHRRRYASMHAGKEEMPVIVQEMDDDTATIFMVDSNLQRESILPSERAKAYKMKMEAINRVKGRPKKEGQVVPDFKGKRTTDIIGEESGESGKQVQRYLRLNNLIPEVLDMVDSKKIAFNPAVELSCLSKDEQESFVAAMREAQVALSLSQTQRMKKFSQEGKCTPEVMEAIMSEDEKAPLDRVVFDGKDLHKYFPKSYTTKQMQDTILKLLEQWQKKRDREQER